MKTKSDRASRPGRKGQYLTPCLLRAARTLARGEGDTVARLGFLMALARQATVGKGVAEEEAVSLGLQLIYECEPALCSREVPPCK